MLNPPDSCGAGGRRPRSCIHAVGLGRSRFKVSISSARACLLVQLDGLFAHHPQAPSSGPTNWWTSWRDSRRHRSCRRRRQLGTSRAHWGSTHRVGRRRCTERAHPVGTSSQGPSGKVGSTKQILVEAKFRETLFSRLSDQEQALIRSQAGPGAGSALTALPTGSATTIPSHLFRIVLLRRLRQPLPLSERSCRCGRLLDVCGHHRAACARAGLLGRRGFSLESIAARICREAKGRVRTNMFVRDMDLAVPGVPDSRRLEVVVDGLPLRGGAQLALDTTLVCALHADGTPRRHVAQRDGVALQAAKRKKVATYPELVGPHSRAKLVVLAVEVGGRWSGETRGFLSQLARARAREEVPLLRRRAEQAWRLRWGAMLGCAAAKAVASSLLNLLDSHGGDGRTPASHQVDRDHRHAGLCA